MKQAESKLNIVDEAMRYAAALARDPRLTKAALARDCGVSRVRVYQMLNILRLPQPILDFIRAHDTPEWKAVLTERRLRPLTGIVNEAGQLAALDDIVKRMIKE